MTAPSRFAAAKCLALDLLAINTLDVLAAAGIDAVLLKGPGLAARLYPEDPASRVYTDVDILVPTGRFDQACGALVEAGYGWRLTGVGPGEFPWHEAPLAAPPGLAGSVDLHRSFAGVSDHAGLFERLWDEADTLVLVGRTVAVPGPIGTTLLAVLHAAAPGRARHPRTDLARADMVIDDDTWVTAVRWGRDLGAGPAVGAAVSLLSPARQDALREVLAGASPIPAHLWLAGRQQSGISVNLAKALHEHRGPWAVARHIGRRMFPSPAFLALWDPRAGRGPVNLARAYAARVRRTVVEAPTAVRDLRRARRAGAAVTGSAGHPERRWIAAAWTVWAVAHVHVQLRRRRLADVRVPRPPFTPRSRDRGAIRRTLTVFRVSCLPAALIWQEWHGRLGRPREVVIGARRDTLGVFRAHAWVDGDPPGGQFTVLHRHPWPGPGGRETGR